MASEHSVRRYRNWYAKLLRLYPKPYRERFGEGMNQTFHDLCRERARAERGLFRFVLWSFFETSAAILRENAARMMRCSMKQGSTTALKMAISLIAIAALAICVFGLPIIAGQEAAKTPKTAYLAYLFLAGACLVCASFFAGLYQAFKLLNYIDRNMAFSELSAGALRRIKYSAVTISTLMMAGIAALMVLSRGKGEDITGVVAPGLLITLASIAVAAGAAVFQRRVEKAIDTRSGTV